MTAATAALGRLGEALAERHLVARGARVLARNYRAPEGELDLVVRHDGDLVAVEVKTRLVGGGYPPEAAVGPAKLARLRGALTRFAAAHGYADRAWRIDVVAVEVERDGSARRVEHLRDAFQ